eukprot:CAMPEP_0118825072 /NCGR_PEP_ID=MMETSP1162-20130426/11039_1 /TAXON_ID=33656 /ORGANISM="Phaeocystis Sp, Strain CCMP2710" /LENGTH=70 /DNA_ID=CAMNT_0006755727 /DNA_START=1 /DNA_END=209 /DNA_ORIENTATION=+
MHMHAATPFGYWALQQGLAHHHSRRPMECADKPFGRRRRRRRRRLKAARRALLGPLAARLPSGSAVPAER